MHSDLAKKRNLLKDNGGVSLNQGNTTGGTSGPQRGWELATSLSSNLTP